jgi:hypothetical protein
MAVLTTNWPIEALAFEEALTSVAESFLTQGKAFNMSRSAVRQLYERVEELEDSASKVALLDLVSNVFGEFDCLAICTSGILESGSNKEEEDTVRRVAGRLHEQGMYAQRKGQMDATEKTLDSMFKQR